MTKVLNRSSLSSLTQGADTPNAESKILAAAAANIQQQIISNGGDPDAVLDHAGIDRRVLGDTRKALALDRYVGMLEFAAASTGNDNFGLHYGEGFKPDMLGLIGRIALTSPTLGSALANLAELFPFHQQATEALLVKEDQLVRLEYRILDGKVLHRRQDAELTMGMFVNVIRSCLGEHWAPEEVHCEHPRPAEWRAHTRTFNAPVYFAQRTNAVVLRAEDMNRRMATADLLQLASLSEELRRIAGGSGYVSVIDQVRSEVRRALPEGGGTLEIISERVGVHRWTLQRRLASEGYNFSDLIDEARQDLAFDYVHRHDMPLTDIAFLLGYAELSAFSRAYKRWHGVPPQRHRNQSGLQRSSLKAHYYEPGRTANQHLAP